MRRLFWLPGSAGVLPAITAILLFAARLDAAEERWNLWTGNSLQWNVVLPEADPNSATLAHTTLSNFLAQFYATTIRAVSNAEPDRVCLVIGTSENNQLLHRLTSAGLAPSAQILGEEGFQLLTHREGASRFIVAIGQTPRAVKHACQELLFYRILATATNGWIAAPLNVTARPEIGYRGVYMLPCWSAHDSLESWRRVLRFNSELTLNRHWFWLDGFPVAQHSGEYAGTALADSRSVQQLFDLAAAEATQIYIGGGWFNWHHEKAVGKNYDRGVQYYLQYLRAFSNFHGFYIEPTGEGSEIKNWRPERDALRRLIKSVLQERPEFEFAVAIGKFNNSEYLKLMSDLDARRVFWWWCWGDPLRDNALELYPSVLRWHISQRMAEFHGSRAPPQPAERALAGMATSYDPGQGFGNPWNGWGKLGVNKPRDFHPHTIPYFGQQYLFRERCWNLSLTHAEFLSRLQRRLFDADTSLEAVEHYWKLSELAHSAVGKHYPTAGMLRPTVEFLSQLRARSSSPKMQDTLARMDEALEQLTNLASK